MRGDVAWSWPGGSASGPTATVPVGAGATVTVTATRTTSAADAEEINGYMAFRHPLKTEYPSPPGWEKNPLNISTEPIRGHWRRPLPRP